MRSWLINSLIGVVIIFIMAIPVSAATNLANNPSFEEENGAFPGGWQVAICDQNPGVTEFKYEKGGGRSGGKFVTILNHSPNDARLKQEISIKEHSLYKISCWVKTLNVDANQKGANISLDGKMETSRDIRGTNGKWEYIEMYVKTGSGEDKMDITAGLGGYGSMTTGQASFDDVVVEEIGIPEGAVVAQVGNMKSVKKDSPAIDFASIGGPNSTIWALIMAAIIVAVAGSLYYIWLIRKSANQDGTV